jgi:predicted GIY-YIG superfamily endonuclease
MNWGSRLLPGVYSVPCECGRVYIGQTGLSVETRIKEHQRHIRLEQPDRSAVAEHMGHNMKVRQATIFFTKPRYIDRMIRKAIEIELHPNNMNREDGLRLSRPWKPLIHTLRGRRKHGVQHCQSLPSH